MNVTVRNGDITQVSVDALITAIDPAGLWFSGIDNVIMSSAGRQYHDVAARALRRNPETHAVVANPEHSHLGQFRNVVFVIDDLREPLNVVVRRGLTVASDAGFKSVSLPMIRLSGMAGSGATVDDRVDEIAMAIYGQSADRMNRIEELTVVVYGDVMLSALMSHALHL